MILQADEEYGLGVSVVTVFANRSSRDLAIIAQTLMSSLTLSAPRVPLNTASSHGQTYVVVHPF